MFCLADLGEGHFREIPLRDAIQDGTLLERASRVWIHVDGIPGQETLSELGERFGLHPLALEDVAHAGERPKVDFYEDHMFTVLGLPERQDGELAVHQVSLFLGRKVLVSFQSGGPDPFVQVRRRLCAPGTRVGARPLDFLFYILVDAVVDQGFPVLEGFGDALEDLEGDLLGEPDRELLDRLHGIRRDLLLLRR
ncbi:MAG TPA: CorA family divalent cation transporter, partial [Gammaproteobacteria bacterium]|nr:CorA family divalent cation transporter [Gammaproteobacteria bacterium]